MKTFKVTLANGAVCSVYSPHGKGCLERELEGTNATISEYASDEPVVNWHFTTQDRESFLLLEVRALRALLEFQNNPNKPETIRVNMSAGQETPFGKILYNLYYGSGRHLLESVTSRSGYPHNGGEHTLYVNATKEDVLSFFDQLEQRFASAKPALDNLREQINSGKKPIRLPRGF